MPLMDCDAPADPVPVLGGNDGIDRLSLLWPNLIRFSRFSYSGGAYAENPFTGYGNQKKAIILPPGGEAALLDRTAGAATVNLNGAAYNMSFYAYIRGGDTAATVDAGFEDSLGGAITGIADRTFALTSTPTLFKWEDFFSDDPDFFAAVPNNSRFRFKNVTGLSAGSEIVITEFQEQTTDYYAPWPVFLPWRPARGEEDLAQYGEYILNANYNELAENPGQTLASNPSGGTNPVLVPNGERRFVEIPDATYTLAKIDDGSLLIFTRVDGCVVTAPAYASVDVKTKSMVSLRRAEGAGPVSLVSDGTSVLKGPPGCIYTITSEGGEARLRKASDLAWHWNELVGNPTNIGVTTIESGEGVPTRTDRAPGALYQRTDVSQLWRYVGDAATDRTAVNIAGTDLKSSGSTNVVTLTGFDPTKIVRFSKPLAVNSGGDLTWDAYSPWPSDGYSGPSPPPTPGYTWKDAFEVYGNNGGSDTLLFSGLSASLHYLTAADAFAGIAALMPVSFTGYSTYKVVGEVDTLASDNRGGVSVLVEELTAGWVLMSDLSRVQLEGVDLDAAPRSLNFTGDGVAATSDGDGNVTVNIDGASGGTDLGWFNVKDPAYGALGDGSTDDTVAVQAAIDACAAASGGTVYFPRGVYVIGGALQDTSRSNAQLLLPRLDYGDDEAITIVLRGEAPPSSVYSVVGSTPLENNLSVIKGTLNTGSGGALIGCHGPSGTIGDFSNIYAVFRDLTVQMPANPVLTAIDCSRVAELDADQLVVNAGSFDIPGMSAQTTSTSYGLRTPGQDNGALTRLGTVNVIGFYNGFEIAEHCVGQDIAAAGCKQAFVFVASHHASHIGRLMVVHCQKGLVFTGEHYFKIDEYNAEHAATGTWVPVYDIDDASNLGKGRLGWHVVLAGVGADTTFLTNGATNIEAQKLDETASQFLDRKFGSTRGNILYRGASGWAVLGPGTAGQLLKTGGAGADPSWFTQPSAAYMPLVIGTSPPTLVSSGGRLIAVGYHP